MRNILFYIPAIIFAVFLSWSIITFGFAFSPVIFVWLGLFLASAIILSRGRFWGGFLGLLPGFHLIYMSIQDTGQAMNIELPLGVITLVIYLLFSCFVYLRKGKLNNENKVISSY